MPGPVVVTLSVSELERAALVGAMREVDGIRRCRRDRDGFRSPRGERWANSVLGAIGEAVVAKATGVAWDARLDSHYHGEDVGPIAVRTGQVGGRLLKVAPRDPDDKPYVLVTGDRETYTVHGWIFGRDAKRPEWFHDAGNPNRPPAYWVPSDQLRDIRELVEILNRRN